MRFDVLGGWELPHFDLASLRVEGYVLLALYSLLLLATLYLRRDDFRVLRGRKLAVFLALLLLTILLNNSLWLSFIDIRILPPPDVPTAPPAPSVPLLGSLTIFVAGALFGAGPAMVMGLLAGLVRGGLETSRVFAPVELAAFGLILGFLLRQTYLGRPWHLLRQPVVAGLFSAGCLWVLLWAGVYTATDGSGLSVLDYTRSLLIASAVSVALNGLLGGLLVQGLYLSVPGLGAPTTGPITPPHLRSMNRRLLTALIPMTLLMVLVVFTAVTTAAINEATNQAIAGMVQRAQEVSEKTPLVFNTGQGLLQFFASDAQLLSPDPQVRQQELEADIKTGMFGPFFSQLILIDVEGNIADYYPDGESYPQLSPEEKPMLQRTLRFGSPLQGHVFATEGGHMISFSEPVRDQDGQIQGMLLGRSRIDINPTVNNLLDSLRGPTGADAGFIVDDRGLVAFHPNQALVLRQESIDLECSAISASPEGDEAQVEGRACKDLAPDSTPRLTYYLPVAALDNWTVVITYPYQAVLEQATRISGQLLLVLLIVTSLLAVTVIWITRRLTRPLQLLAAAARNISAGELDDQVTLDGDDEVAQLGGAFEQMRLSLKDRLDDLALLLHVSQTVSGNLDMSHGIQTILEGVLQATDARFGRLILLDERGDPQVVMAHGEGGGYVTALDRAMARLGRGGGPVRIENTAETRGLIDPKLVGTDIKALVAVPIHGTNRRVGVMWLGYDDVHRFNDTEVDFLSTLASQAAVVVENSRLYQAAEGGRRRLAAILESTGDSVIVTDPADRVLLLNPAAAEVFDADSITVTGKPIAEVVKEENVIELLRAPINDGVPLTKEVPLPDGRTFYASSSAIVGADGQNIGRVAVLRDITYLKELDEVKSEFVATVSHDLRAPLTFMRGYATMIPMVGEVSSKQKRYVDKIMVGIEQMTELIDDLLDLGRIEAGVDLMNEPCRLDDIITAQVHAMRPQATAYGLALRLGHTEDVTVVVGDAALLRRVITNLVDNAIKYTPKGGEITVSWETRGNKVLISVADTGIGIAKADHVHLFEKFSRIKRRETIGIKGSGLGLAIVKSIVDRHNGRVWVESELEKGSTFYVELPIGELPSAHEMPKEG
jgi:PAS domain S-box-containing protein